MILTSNFSFQLFAVCDTRKLFLFCRLMTPYPFYLRQKVRGSRLKLLGQATRFEASKLGYVTCCHVKVCAFLRSQTQLLLAVKESNTSRILNTPINFKEQYTYILHKNNYLSIFYFVHRFSIFSMKTNFRIIIYAFCKHSFC